MKEWQKSLVEAVFFIVLGLFFYANNMHTVGGFWLGFGMGILASVFPIFKLEENL